MVVICSSLSHRTLKFLTDPSTFASISMGRGTAWKAHDVDVVRGWMAAGKTTTAMATLRPDWSMVQHQEARGPFESESSSVVMLLDLCSLASGPSQRFPAPSWTSSRPNYPRCLGCRLTLSQKNLGRPVPQRGGCCTTDWRKSHTSLSELSGSLLLPFSVAWRSVA